jgi:hypothetical protein
MSDNTEEADTNQPKPEIVSEKSDVTIMISSDESTAADDGQSTAKRRQVKREKGNFAPGPIASRLRSRQKKV